MAADPRLATMKPIGYIENAKNVKFRAGHQPDETDQSEEGCSYLRLLENEGYEDGLRDLEGFDRIWLIFWFDRNTTWRPLVLPPRGPKQRRGVFATRSPHRPNPIGLTPVRLLDIDGLILKIGPCDLIEGTPVFDIKPYIPAYDAFPGSISGWVDEVDELEKNLVPYEVLVSDEAQEQADFLNSKWKIELLIHAKRILAKDPSPHRTRRIHRSLPSTSAETCQEYTIHCGAWRLIFTTDEHKVHIKRIGPGFPRSTLMRNDDDNRPDFDAQLDFLDRYPNSELTIRVP